MSTDGPQDELLTAIPEAEDTPRERYVSHESLIRFSRAIKKHGKRLVISYAGDSPKRVSVSYLSGRAAREAAGYLMADLRQALTDLQYNRIVDSFLSEIKKAQLEREAGDKKPDLVDVACPGCNQPLQLSPVFVDKALDLCPKCNLDPVCPDGRDWASCPKCQTWNGQSHDQAAEEGGTDGNSSS